MLALSDIEIKYQQRSIVNGFSLHIEQGEIGCLIGPSGCGKTTLLRAIAGFEPIHSGSIKLHDRVLSDARFQLPPEQRDVGMVFQDFALFPHLTIFANIAFGLKKQPLKQQQQRVAQLLERVGLSGFEQRYPHQLSGGQQQRVALARALAPKPRMLLMDEPFSSLDALLRESLASEVRSLLKVEEVTALLVTHDQQEAFAIADRLGVMQDGQLLQWSTPYNLYHQPQHPFIADFIGTGVLLESKVTNQLELDSPLGLLNHYPVADNLRQQTVQLLVRPDDITLDNSAALRARVVGKAFRGAYYLYTAELNNGSRVLCMAPSHSQYQLGEEIGLRLNFHHLVLFPKP
jgi:iron(III) transport system ATP-binding protein